MVKLGEDPETHKLRAQGDHNQLKARETAVAQQRLVEETRHLQAEENANSLIAPGCRRGKWLGYSAATAGIVGLGLSLAWMSPGSFAILYAAADEWLSGNLFRDEATETIPEPAAPVPVPESLAPDRVAQGREDRAREPSLFQPRLDQEQWDAARTRLDEAAVIAPESEAVAGLGDEIKARESRQVSIREVTPSRIRVRPGETVRFYTTYALSLPESDTEAHVKATWALLRDGRKIGREGIDNRYARAGLNTAVTELTLPPDRIRAIHRRASGAGG